MTLKLKYSIPAASILLEYKIGKKTNADKISDCA